MKKALVILLVLMMLIPAALADEAAASSPFTVYPPQKAHATFTLEGNPTTGYAWTAFLLKEGVVTLVHPEGEYTPDETAEEGMVGVGGAYAFDVVAENPGETVLLLQYGRAWENEDAETKAYLIHVSDDGQMFIRDLEGIAPMVGQVSSVDAENHTALLETETHSQVMARFPADMELPVAGEEVKIWFNGIMTMSLPGQINVIAWETIAPEKAREN